VLLDKYIMAHPLSITVKESIKELRSLQRKHGELIGKRMQMLIEIKRHENEGGLFKRALSDITGINHNSIVKWRNAYLKGGIAELLTHGRKGFKKSIFSEAEHHAIKQKLSEPTNGIVGFKELQQWVEDELNKPVKYIILLKYVQRKFGAKVKTARKSHIKKDKEAVEAFKKTSVKSA
jgi:transposase